MKQNSQSRSVKIITPFWKLCASEFRCQEKNRCSFFALPSLIKAVIWLCKAVLGKTEQVVLKKSSNWKSRNVQTTRSFWNSHLVTIPTQRRKSNLFQKNRRLKVEISPFKPWWRVWTLWFLQKRDFQLQGKFFRTALQGIPAIWRLPNKMHQQKKFC